MLKPTHPRDDALQQEKPPQCEAHAPQLERRCRLPLATTREKPAQSHEDLVHPKIKQRFKNQQ